VISTMGSRSTGPRELAGKAYQGQEKPGRAAGYRKLPLEPSSSSAIQD
jgi:hypothetical protein